MNPLISLPSPLPARLRAVTLLTLLLAVATPASSADQERFDPAVSGQFGATTDTGIPPAPARSDASAEGGSLDLTADDRASAPSPANARGQLENHRRQAQAALNRNDTAQALRLATAGLRASPHDARLRFVRGVALRRLKRLPEAETEFRQLIDEFPELPEPYNNLAVVLAAQGRLDDAREALERAIHAVPGYALAHENLGDLYLQQARDSWMKARRLAPGNERLAARLKALKSVEALSSLPTASSGTDSSSRRSR